MSLVNAPRGCRNKIGYQKYTNSVYKRAMRLWFTFAVFMLFAFGIFSPAEAHPHAWISVKTTVIVNEKDEAVALREHWLFDKAYSAYASKDYDPHKNGKFADEDLVPLARENLSNLKEFNYFTVFENGEGKSVKFGNIRDIASAYEDAPASSKQKVIVYATPKGQPEESSGMTQIGMDFTLPLEKPVSLRAKTPAYRIYDPTYYVDMTHYEHNAVTFIREADGKEIASCRAKVELPKIDESMIFNAAALDRNATAPKDFGLCASRSHKGRA